MPADSTLDVVVSLRVGSLELEARLATSCRRVAVVGPSGSGKSTLLRVLAGLEPRAAGRVAFCGSVWSDSDRREFVPAWERRVGWVPQDVRLLPHKTVDENLRFAGAARPAAAEVARRLGVETLLARRPRNLSGGEAQRVALGRAILATPRLLLLDEPFAALDRTRRSDVVAYLREVSEAQDLAIVLVSHDERDVAALADAVFEMADGQVGPSHRARAESQA